MAKEQRVLVTGTAGFIGYHLSKALCREGYLVTGVDNLNEYYDVELKKARLSNLLALPPFTFHKVDLTDKAGLMALFSTGNFDYVVNLAAQAGVRFSLTNPHAYIESNVHGFLNLLEGSRKYKTRHLIYASSSSVYGANTALPFSTHQNTDHPISLYAATKKANEMMAHAYSSLFDVPATGLRFFTVYGPFGRPDMAIFIFTKAILEGTPINVFNNGRMKRDFTFVDDVVECVVRLVRHIPVPDAKWNSLQPDPATSYAPYRLYNIGNKNPVDLLYLIEIIEKRIGKKAVKNLMPMQDGDVPETFANMDDLVSDIDFEPGTPIEVGVARFVDWYLEYYRLKN